MRFILTIFAMAVSCLSAMADVITAARSAGIVVLGEVHDNPAHHVRQAEWVAALAPTALVFEMLTPDQAQAVAPTARTDKQALETALGWANTGWPDFAMYFPIFVAAPDAAIFGAALTHDRVRGALTQPIAEMFGPDAARFGLTEELPSDERAARMDLQWRAHCEALPAETLPKMVAIQRLRDALLAQAALQALTDTGGPVVVITGNGHARTDWGVPALIKRADGDAHVFALGQAEAGLLPEGTFDAVLDAPGVDRPDPCAAFR